MPTGNSRKKIESGTKKNACHEILESKTTTPNEKNEQAISEIFPCLLLKVIFLIILILVFDDE